MHKLGPPIKSYLKGKLYSFEVAEISSQSYFVFLPNCWSRDSKILVCVHGISRKSKEQIRLLRKSASASNTILIVPYFTATEHPSYQRHEVGLNGVRSDELLNNIIADTQSRLEINIEKFDLFGFSGGAQFSHRYAFRYPHKISKLIVCAAGWYTFPNLQDSFPYGIADNEVNHFIQGITDKQLSDFLKIPITVAVGEYDIGFESSLNQSKEINSLQGYTRVERAISWTKSLLKECENRNISPQIKFILLQKSGHSFTECVNFGRLSSYIF